MVLLASILLNRTFLTVLILCVVAACVLLAYGDFQQMSACWGCLTAGKHNPELELREDSIAAILVAVGVLFESFETLARKAGSRLSPDALATIHRSAEACAVKGTFIVVFGLAIEMVNQVTKNISGNHAIIHLVQASINLPLAIASIVLLLAVLRDISQTTATQNQ
jgi:uncharacterized membrane protein